MKSKIGFIALFALFSQTLSASAQTNSDLASFQTKAVVARNGDALNLSSAVASIEPAMFKGYYWLYVYFYAFQPTPDDLADITVGKTKSMDHRQAMLPIDQYNHGRAVVKLTLDKDFKVTQVDAEIPGHGCTLSDDAAKAVAATFKIDGNRAMFKAGGTYPCQPLDPSGAESYSLSLDVDTQVFKVQK